MTGEGLGGEVKDLEQLIKRHDEYRSQIDRQLDKSEIVKNEGRRLMEEGNFMSQEVCYPPSVTVKISIIFDCLFKN